MKYIVQSNFIVQYEIVERGALAEDEEDEDEEYFEDEGSDSAGETEAGEENRGAVNEEESESKIVQPRSDAADSADDLAETDEEQKN